MKKVPGRPFKKGVSGNPNGRPRLPDEIKEARALTQSALHKTINELIHCSRDELALKLKDPQTTMLQLMIGSIISQATQKGDQLRLNFVLDRLIGKVKEDINLSGGVHFNLVERAKELESLDDRALEKIAQLPVKKKGT